MKKSYTLPELASSISWRSSLGWEWAKRYSFDASFAMLLFSRTTNGVDLEYFTPPQDAGGTTEPPMLVFTGAMDYFPNVDAVDYFCREIFPYVHEAVPAAQLYIFGRNPTKQVRQLSRQSNIMVTGAVPDVRP